MASHLRDAAADFARRAAERRAMIEERGLREADVPAVELPTAPKVEVEGNLLQMGREGGAGAGDDSMAEEEADEEIF